VLDSTKADVGVQPARRWVAQLEADLDSMGADGRQLLDPCREQISGRESTGIQHSAKPESSTAKPRADIASRST
jgi:hypothetical protein